MRPIFDSRFMKIVSRISRGIKFWDPIEDSDNGSSSSITVNSVDGVWWMGCGGVRQKVLFRASWKLENSRPEILPKQQAWHHAVSTRYF